VPAGNQGPSVSAGQSVVTAAGGHAAAAATQVPGLPSQRDGLGDGLFTGGLSWRLPDDASCAGTARAHMRQALADLQMPGELIHDAAVAVSELATNAWLHALDARPLSAAARPGAVAPELWVYRRGAPPDAELVCGVFDTRRDAWPQARPDSSMLPAEDTQLTDPQLDAILAGNTGNGHGLGIVAALSRATGWHRTRSRSGDHPPGKVIWFTVRIPDSSVAAQPPPVRLAPAQAARTLTALLTARGIPGIGHHHDTTQSAVSITASLTIRCQDGAFRWQSRGSLERRAYFDLADTVENLIRLHEEMVL
jgi:hypothetical protein